MTRRLRFTLCIAFLAFPNLASAEPLPSEWSYTAHIRTSTGLGVLDLGTYSLWNDPTGLGSGELGNYKITTPLSEANLSGSYQAYPGQSNGAIRLGYVGYPFSVDPVESAPAADPTFLLTFTLTDTASGESATLEFTGNAGAATDGQFPPLILFSADLYPMDAVEVTLGKNRYRVKGLGGLPDEIEEAAQFGVRVDATALTPEPATLVMAGFGIGAIGLIRARRVSIKANR